MRALDGTYWTWRWAPGSFARLEVATKTDKSKPSWLAAKTAGECAARCMAETPGRWIDRCEVVAQAVIEWHEAQRERIGEYWRVDYERIDIKSRAIERYSRQFVLRCGARHSAKCQKKQGTHVSIAHVTCYRRKR